MCELDTRITFGAKICTQLPRQTILGPPSPSPQRYSIADVDRSYWTIRNQALQIRYTPCELVLLPPTKRTKQCKRDTDACGSRSVPDVFLEARRNTRAIHRVYDTKQIGLLRVRICNNTSEPAYVIYTEVPCLEDVESSGNRRKVHLADKIISNASRSLPGFRGSRYIHVISDKAIELSVWRREVALLFHEPSPSLSSDIQVMMKACRTNIIACVDGGMTDTCWRERAQWTGDARMLTKAVRQLVANWRPIATLTLHQIASSYNARTGMVNGAWPVRDPTFSDQLPIPTFHLAFCLCVVENDIDDDLCRNVVSRSISFWKSNYLKDGIIQGLPGWHFIDWDTTVPDTHKVYKGGNAVCNAWWYELSQKAKFDSGIDVDTFHSQFRSKSGFSMWPNQSDPSPSVHATAAILASKLSTHGTEFILAKWKSDGPNMGNRVTAYFAYFVMRAIERGVDKNTAKRYATEYYLPIAKKYNSIYEKTDDRSSLAHGWSVAFITIFNADI